MSLTFSQNSEVSVTVFAKACEHWSLPEPASEHRREDTQDETTNNWYLDPLPFSHGLPPQAKTAKSSMQSAPHYFWSHLLMFCKTAHVWDASPGMFLKGKALVGMWQDRKGCEHYESSSFLIQYRCFYHTRHTERISFHDANPKIQKLNQTLKYAESRKGDLLKIITGHSYKGCQVECSKRKTSLGRLKKH